MKSKKLITGLLVLTLLTPTIVKADMDAPGIIIKDGVIAQEEGADYYSLEGEWPNDKLVKKGHYDKGTKIESHYEIKKDGTTYVQTCNDKCFYVKASDVLPGGGPISPDYQGVYKLNKPEEYMVVVDEVEIKEGPASSYKTVGKLKKGDKGKHSYEYSAYMYVEVNGVKGWVDMLHKQVLTSGRDLITREEVDTDCGKMPANTILTNVWDTTPWDGESLVKYNGKECYVESFHSTNFYYFMEPNKITATGTGKMYEKADAKKVITDVPKGATVTILATMGGTHGPIIEYAEYNGTKGWYYEPEEEQPTSTPVPTTTPEPTSTPEPTATPDTTGDIAPPTDPEVIKPNKSEGLDTMTILIMCCIGAIAVALTALVTIILVNKKNKKKIKELESKIEEEKVPEEVKVEEPVEETVEEIKIEEPTEEVTEETNDVKEEDE